MTLGAFLRSRRIGPFAFLTADVPPVVKPRLLSAVPDARTVLFAAIPYYTAAGESNLARFARCRDYHAFAGELGAACSALLKQKYPDSCAAGFADHSPYAEVRGAAMAGLGILGDHGLLITKQHSSYVFLFELLTTLTAREMENEDIPQGNGILRECDHCGACTAVCPGGCRNDDRSGCLSAITQKKGELTDREKSLLRSAPFAWGCDLCQEVCPHTAAALALGTVETEIPYFRDPILGILTEEELDALSEEEYARYAFGWRKKEVMRRNLRLQKEEKSHD